MCYKLVDEESGKIICRSVIRSATEPGTANLRIDPIEPLPPNATHNTNPDAMLDKMMKAADFKTPVSDVCKKVPVETTPASTETMNWRVMVQSKQVEHQEDI